MHSTLSVALEHFVRQRPGFEPGNYVRDWQDKAGRAALRADMRTAQRDRAAALAMLAYCNGAGIAVTLPDRGRLSWDGSRLDYTTGQYWCVEYRAAACRALADCIWSHWRDAHGGMSADGMRKYARELFGAYAARRYFN